MRAPGAQMIVGKTECAGFLSGGCIERDVELHARKTILDGVPRHLVYGHGSPWIDTRLPCGGRIDILVERLTANCTHAQRLASSADSRDLHRWVSDGRVPRLEQLPGTQMQASARLLEGGPRIEVIYSPRTRLVVVGWDPMALALASVATMVGLETCLARPCGPSEPPPIPGVRYLRGGVDEISGTCDSWSAIALMTHDLELEDELLARILPGQAFYVGALGSARRRPERLRRLAVRGVSTSDAERLRSPIGLPLGASAPLEIASSIVSDVIKASKSQPRMATSKHLAVASKDS